VPPPLRNTYNGAGVRVGRSSSGTSTAYLQDLAIALPVILRESTGSSATDYVWAHGLLSQQNTSSYSVALPDGLGSVRGSTNATGQLTAAVAFDGYGNMQLVQGPRTTTFGFAGEQEDPATSLLNLRARSYDPRVGRFASRDSFVQGGPTSQGFNRLAYAGDRPTILIDPSGHTMCEASHFGVGGVFQSTVIDFKFDVFCPDIPSLLPHNSWLDDFLRNAAGCDWTTPDIKWGIVDEFPEQGGHTYITPLPQDLGGVVAFEENDAGTRGPNPNGSRGSLEHQRVVNERIEELKAQGYVHIGGGSEKEEWIPIPAGGESLGDGRTSR
jgi:RHS repeat-associated protein